MVQIEYRTYFGRVSDGHVPGVVVTDVVQESLLPGLGLLVVCIVDVVVDSEGDNEGRSILVVVRAFIF